MANYFRSPTYGDIGEIIIKSEQKTSTLTNEEFSALDIKEQIAEAIKCGVDLKIICNVSDCSKHKGFIELKASFNPKGYTYGVDRVWCEGCFTWMRTKKPQL